MAHCNGFSIYRCVASLQATTVSMRETAFCNVRDDEWSQTAEKDETS